MSKRIVFAGTPEFAVEALQALLNSSSNSGSDSGSGSGSGYSIVAVYTQPDRPAGRGQTLKPSPVKVLATKHHLPVYQPARLKSAEEQAILRDLNPDYLIVAAYGLILPQAVLEIPKFGCINIHASLLPRWRGAAPIQHAILANDKQSGITIMQMDVGLDTGDILSLYPCDINRTDTSGDLHDRLGKLGAKALLETLEKLEKNQITPQKQDPSLASYATKISKEDALIDWQESASMIDCKIRAFNPWPVAYTFLQGQENPQIRIWKAMPCEMISNTNTNTNNKHFPGTIMASDKDGIIVATGNRGALRVLEIQLPGGKRLPVSEILNSKRELFNTGQQFGMKSAFGI